jgi:hypothetical protein
VRAASVAGLDPADGRKTCKMDQTVILEKYPVFIMRLLKEECTYGSLDGIVEYFLERIDEHPIARFIATFDHYAHTRALAEGEIAPEVRGAKNIVFCFGTALPNPEILALRPRSVGVAEMSDHFVVSFLEAPMPIANTAMEGWARGLRRSDGARSA